ncbi:MAG: translation initiation factor IF-3 [Deltaproteobacteria bacterium RIFCSPLOWO2_02_FULL_44_10]|nr:MAG: translation initiation factor IF-3 [Deltaproteobacteria bacterium RIFCSPHIGHO2_02_FULL_44_16]OGQ47395.1 MAG: translation initiation factor IF-3 [Deltaproteobacteria bacterium RIFCSPLOWO2_02_FULL_44_10]
MPTRAPIRKDELRRNHRIRVPEVRLIGSQGEQLGIFITPEAIRRAEEEGLDLVEISPTAKPPVCKIMDYGKYKYEQSKKKHEAKKHQIVVKTKEIKLRVGTDEHDYQTKLKHVRKFFEIGDKVKITLRFRGREMSHKELGEQRMKRIIEDVKDVAEVAQATHLEGKQMQMLLAPLKKTKK